MTTKKPTRTDLDQLLAHTEPFSVSVYLPADEVGLEPTQRRAQLVNSIQEIKHKLQALRADLNIEESIITKLLDLQRDDTVWEVGPQSLAFFITPTLARAYQLPISVKSLIHISDHFHLKPLIRAVTEPADFYLLSLNKDAAELYKGDRYQLTKVQVPNLPHNIEAVVGVETDSRHLQFHTSSDAPRGGERPAAFHGQSQPWKDDRHAYVEKFIQAIEKAVTDFLEDQKAPLLLAGVERMITLYRETTSLSTVVPVHLKANDGSLSLAELHQQAIALLEPYFIDQERTKVQKVIQEGNGERFSFSVDEILKEAEMGRVEMVLVAQGVREWGRFEPLTLRVTHADGQQLIADDLLDTACAVTLLNGGQAYVLPLDQMPADQPVVAIYRY